MFDAAAIRSDTLLAEVTATGAGNSVRSIRGASTFQASGSVASATGAATIAVQVSDDNINWLTLGTITLALTTTSSSDGFASDAPWAFVRGNVTAISGTGAAISLIVAR